VDKCVVIPSDRYLRPSNNINTIREDWRNVKRVKPMQHRQMDHNSESPTQTDSESKAAAPMAARVSHLAISHILPVSASQ
jgi:hypothetical protein